MGDGIVCCMICVCWVMGIGLFGIGWCGVMEL